jgi:thioesterase domain-containing protein
MVHPGRLALLQAAESRDNSAAWARYAAGGVDRVEVPGDHYSMWSAPNLPALVAALEARIARALGD